MDHLNNKVLRRHFAADDDDDDNHADHGDDRDGNGDGIAAAAAAAVGNGVMIEANEVHTMPLAQQQTEMGRIRSVAQYTIYTSALFYSFIAVGVCCSIFNPTLIQLSHILDTSLEAVSFIFPLRAIGCTVGTLINGVLNSYFNRQVLLVIFLILKALTTFLVPHWTSLQQFYINAFFQGFFTAVNVVMVNVWVNEMWSNGPKKRNQPENDEQPTRINLDNVLMQSLHFFFGFGSILGPLIAEPFLKNPFQGFDDRFVSNNLVWPYFIAAALAISSALIIFILFLVMPYEQKGRQLEKSESTSNLLPEPITENCASRQSNHEMIKVSVIVSCALFAAVFACSEGTYLQFSASFCAKTKLHLSQPQSALMASILAISFTVFRGLSVLIALKLSPSTMILLDLFAIFLGDFLVFLFADQNVFLLATGFVLLGAGFSSIVPSLFPLLERNGYTVTDWVGSLITFASGAAQVLAPFIIGLWIEQVPYVLVYLTFASFVASCFFYCLMHILIRIHRNTSR